MIEEAMPRSELVQLVQGGDLDAFEARCLERLECGDLQLAELAAPLRQLEQAGHAGRLATLAQMALENTNWQADPDAAFEIARIALTADPRNAELRKLAVDAFRQAHRDIPGVDGLLAASGLAAARPARSALNVLELGLSLKKGDALLSRTEDLVVEVIDSDLAHGLFTLRRAGRPATISAAELASGYERLDPDDFRVLRQLRPERLNELIQQDPLALVTGVLRARGDRLDADTLKHELVPRYIAPKDWPRWWAKARTALKRCPHVIVEGRAPVLLRYCAEGRTLEDETWATFAAENEPVKWLRTIEGYLREKRQRKEAPDRRLLERFHAHLTQRMHAGRPRRPVESLAAALVLERLARRTASTDEQVDEPAAALLREAGDPGKLIGGLEDEVLWESALDALLRARPHDGPRWAVKLMPRAPASALDRIVAIGLAAGLNDAVQQHIDRALADPVRHPELYYWLWKGPQHAGQLRLPPAEDWFGQTLAALSALGRTQTVSKGVARAFRLRMRAALALRDYQKVRDCLEHVSPERAITLRRQLERLEGVGDKARSRMLRMLREFHPQVWAAAARRLRPWEDPEVLWSTAEGLQRKTQQRDHLVNVTMRENAKRIGEAAAHGDLSENSEYRFALEERDLLRARLAQMNTDLAKARALEPHQIPTEHVGVGSRVTLRNVADGGERVMTFLGPFDTDVEQGIYSYLAPVAQQLMGRTTGERVTLTIDGREVEFEITAITSGLPGGT